MTKGAGARHHLHCPQTLGWFSEVPVLSSVVETGFQCIFWPISGHIKPGALLSPLRVFFPLIKSVQNGVTFGAASVGDGAGIIIRISVLMDG